MKRAVITFGQDVIQNGVAKTIITKTAEVTLMDERRSETVTDMSGSVFGLKIQHSMSFYGDEQLLEDPTTRIMYLTINGVKYEIQRFEFKRPKWYITLGDVAKEEL